MKRVGCIVTLLILLVSTGCKSSKSVATQAEIDNLTKLINKGHYRIESDWVYPQVTAAVQRAMSSGLLPPGNSPNAISLIGNSNFLEVKKDSVSSYLPYFGERHMQVGYAGSDSTIQFDGLVQNYKVSKNKNDGYKLSFEALSNSEKFNVNITIFPNLKADITLSGVSRLGIRYSGRVIEQ